MLAYRHAFHAGNHADVLKHTVLGMVLRYMNQKEKPYRLVDTHAGAGGYSLEGQYATKKGEFEQGIAGAHQHLLLPPEHSRMRAPRGDPLDLGPLDLGGGHLVLPAAKRRHRVPSLVGPPAIHPAPLRYPPRSP